MSKDKDSHTPGTGKTIWKAFASVRLTVVVLLTIAAAAIIGTLIPQNRPDAFYHMMFSQMRFGTPLYNLADRLDLFNMYQSIWFQALMLILAVNILVCSIDRLKIVWQIVFPKKRTYSAKAFKTADAPPPIEINAPLTQIKGIYKTTLSQMFKKSHWEDTADGFAVFSEKGRATRLGVYVVHGSILVLLVGALVGWRFGLDGYVNIPEGESTRVVSLSDSADPHSPETHTLDFAIRCDDFDVQFYDNGMPREYRSTLSLLDGDNVLLTKDIRVNQPLRYKGVNLFQSSYGLETVKKAKMRFTSKDSGMEYYHVMEIGDIVKIPENLGLFKLIRFTDSYMFKGVHNLGPAMVGVLDWGEKSEPVFLPVKFDGFDKMRQDVVVISVADFEKQYYTGLQVTRDPGVPLVYLGFILMIIGIYVSFFTSHQQFCVRVVESDGKTTVTVLGKANKNKPAVQRRAETIREQLAVLTQ